MTRVGVAGLYALAYVLWLANCALAALALVAARQLLVLTVLVRVDVYARRAVDQVTVLIMVVVWLGWAVYAEAIYRGAATRSRRLAAAALGTHGALGALLIALGAGIALAHATLP